MPDYDLVRQLPLATAAIWGTVAAWPFLLRRVRNPTERAFVLFAALVGAWAALDWLFLSATDPEAAILISKIRVTAISLAMVFLLLFAKWLTVGRSTWDPLLALPAALAAAMNWTIVVQGVEMSPWGPRLVRDPLYFLVWLAQFMAYLLVSLAIMTRSLPTLSKGHPDEARRILVVVAGALIGIVAWLVLLIYSNFSGLSPYTAQSSLALVPGLLVLLVMVPLPRPRAVGVFRGLAERQGSPRAAYLIDATGKIMASAGLKEGAGPGTSLSDSLRLIDSVISQSFQSEAPEGVRTLSQGDMTFLVERGVKFTLVLAVQGKVNDIMRSDVREALHALEGDERATAPGRVERFLEALLQPLEVF